ncbi:MAG: hypothetical protein HY822_13680 [Acidobacteria bacterium]|nr:hypothetical protein [Acidobacteriota bacterium]
MNHRTRNAVTPGLVVGLLAIALGVFFLLRNFGLIRYFSSSDLFAIVLIVFGLANLFGSCCSSGRAWGGLLTAAGGLWLAGSLGLVPWRFSQVWPVLLILLGGFLLWRTWTWRQTGGVETAASPSLRGLAIFGGGKRAVTAKDFRGGEVFAVLGGQEVDLKGADIEGSQAVVDATALLGGVELRVPYHWDVVVEGVAFFGGYEDKTQHPREGETAKRLIVRGFAIFGGVEVKN